MGQKKFRNPYQIGKRTKADAGVLLASSLAMAEYNARKEARKIMGVNKEVIARENRQDTTREIWQWGLMAVVLHRRYRFTAPKIAEILTEIQTLHNEIYDPDLEDIELSAKVFKLVKEEVGLSIFDEDMREGECYG